MLQHIAKMEKLQVNSNIIIKHKIFFWTEVIFVVGAKMLFAITRLSATALCHSLRQIEDSLSKRSDLDEPHHKKTVFVWALPKQRFDLL